MSETKRSFVTLDGLRGIAALAILTLHAPHFFAPLAIDAPSPDGAKPLPVPIFFEGYLAVDFFFVLSGFVLAHAYGQRLRDGLPALQFITVRIIRLYPLYLFALAISVMIAWRQVAQGETTSLSLIKNVLFAILFLPSPSLSGHGLLFPLNAPAWSLFFELVANGCLGLMGRRLENITLFVIVLTAGLALMGAVAAGMFGFGPATAHGAMHAGFDWGSFGAGSLRVTYSFFAGVLVYRIWTIWRPSFKISSLVVAASLIAILVSHPTKSYQTAFDLIVTIGVFPILIWLGASSVSNRLTGRVFLFLGAASYAVYVLQTPLYALAIWIFDNMLQEDTGHLHWLWAFVFLAFVFAVAVIADRYFDRPIRAILMARVSANAAPALIFIAMRRVVSGQTFSRGWRINEKLRKGSRPLRRRR